MKDKLILKDLTEMELETGASLSQLGVKFPDKAAMTATWDKLTPDNLSSVQIENGDGLTVGNYTGLILVSETSTIQPDGSILTSFHIREKNEIEKRLDAVEEGQNVQDGAIMDVAEVLSVIAETQEGDSK